jgi:uncharacterized protein YoxC
MLILDILLAILILVGIVLCVYLIITLTKLNSTLNLLQEGLKNTNSKLEPVLENLNIIVEKAVNISGETERRVLDISNTIQNVRDTVRNFSFKGKSSSFARNPIQELLSNLSAFSKGVSAFWKKIN